MLTKKEKNILKAKYDLIYNSDKWLEFKNDIAMFLKDESYFIKQLRINYLLNTLHSN